LKMHYRDLYISYCIYSLICHASELKGPLVISIWFKGMVYYRDLHRVFSAFIY
jgi:hypothetical protein